MSTILDSVYIGVGAEDDVARNELDKLDEKKAEQLPVKVRLKVKDATR